MYLNCYSCAKRITQNDRGFLLPAGEFNTQPDGKKIPVLEVFCIECYNKKILEN